MTEYEPPEDHPWVGLTAKEYLEILRQIIMGFTGIDPNEGKPVEVDDVWREAVDDIDMEDL